MKSSINNRGFVYLLCDGEKFKIGMTRQKNIEKRIKELQTGNSYEIWLRAYYETDYPLKIEKMMHAKHFSSNVKNEWFDMTVEDVINFKKNCIECERILNALKDNPFI
ncbi:GIY-YIG nuclease family protein [bacterium]|nr:GIY-YIG nuclease family protein [bacterium]